MQAQNKAERCTQAVVGGAFSDNKTSKVFK